MPVPTARKESMIQMEYASGFMKYVTMDKVYLQEQCTYNGYTYTVYKGSGDGGAAGSSP